MVAAPLVFEHQPVMVQEVLRGLNIQASGIYIDGTFGRGGHSQHILAQLNQSGHLYAMDRDPAAAQAAESLKKSSELQKKPFTFVQQAFSNLLEFCKTYEIVGKVDGLLLDLGVSSPQLDDASRGFSFNKSGPLDMRMNPEQGLSAADWINTAEESDMLWVFKEYGEERFSKRIAGAICQARSLEPITTTDQLANIIAKAHPAWEQHKHPATRCFQAIRIFINHELDELAKVLEQSLDVLAPKGRLAVISFHSLEDRMVKRFIQKHERDQTPSHIPIMTSELNCRLRRIGSKQKASETESFNNRRARSAVLRIAEKVGV